MKTQAFALLLILIIAAPHARGGEQAILTLADALRMAEHNHPDIAAAGARIQEASAMVLQAGLFPNPSLFGRLEAAPLTSGGLDDADAIAGFSQPLPLGRRLDAARRVERLRQQRLAYERQSRLLTLRREVQTAFVEALHWQATIGLWERAVEIAARGVDAAQAALDAGDSVPADLARAQVEWERAQLERDRAHGQYIDAIDALAVSMGCPDASIDALAPEPLDDVPTTLDLDLLLDWAMHSPLLAVYDVDVELERARIDLAREEAKPDLELEVAYRHIGEQDDSAIDVGFVVPLPVFDRNQGLIRARRAEMEAAKLERQSARNQVQLEIRAAHRRLSRAVDRVQRLRDSVVPRAEESLRGAELMYQGGETNLIDVLTVRRDWLEVQLDYLQACWDAMNAWAALTPYVTPAVFDRSPSAHQASRE